MKSFFSALAFLTIVPVPRGLVCGGKNSMFYSFPLVGLLIGAVTAAVLISADVVFGSIVSAALAVTAGFILTGAIHLDGLADCADAFYGRRSREDVLRILKDPRIGTMGGLAIGISLIMRVACLASLGTRSALLILPLACAFSRTSVAFCVQILPYARAGGGILKKAPSRSAPLLVTAGAAAVAVTALAPVCALAAAAALAAFWPLARRKTGGYTGDVLGASIEIAEIAFLLAAVGAARTGTDIGLLQAFGL
jgi:adenosylcobinamide-GDP ribazoletransferase